MSAPRLYKGRNGCVAAGFTVIGFFCTVGGLFFFWPIAIAGILLLILATMLDKPAHVCGACGNSVSATSTLCPICRTTLHEYRMSAGRALVVTAWCITILLLIIGTIWLIQNQPHR